MHKQGNEMFKVGASVGASKTCIFGNCSTDSRSSSIPFVRFPKPCLEVRRKKTSADADHLKVCVLCSKCTLWIAKCGRSDGKFETLEHVKRWHYICALHFVDDIGATSANLPYPLKESEATEEKKIIEKKRKNALGEICTIPSKKHTTEAHNFQAYPGSEETKLSIKIFDSPASHIHEENNEMKSTSRSPPITKETSTQTTFTWKSAEQLQNQIKCLQEVVQKLKKENKEFRKKLKPGKSGSSENFSTFVESLSRNNKKCIFYTSFPFRTISALLLFLSPVQNMHYWGTKKTVRSLSKMKKLSNLEEFVVMLIRLRTGLLVEDMNYRFNISTGLVSKIVTTWVQHCYLKFNVIRPLMFSTREKIKSNLPPLFKKLKNIRVIIDCAEFYCQGSSNFEQQGNLYSSYKATSTFKVLLGCTPNGAISFVSDVFEGSISDRKLFERSKLLDFLEEGDLALADRGFTISDLTNAKNVSLNIPPFLKGRQSLTAEEEIQTEEKASKRIYIEHVVGRIKEFRLLRKRLPLNMRGIMSQVIFVCACLTNFRDPILK